MPIEKIEFSLLSPAQIKKISVVEITRPELYDADGYPVEHGIVDPRLGVVDPGVTCRSCGGRIGDCMGHFGRIELVKAVVHPVLAPKIYTILQTTCSKCGKFIAKEEVKKSDEESKKGSSEKCPYCRAKQKKIKFEKPTTFYADKEKLTAEEVREWLEKIPDEDLEKLKFKGGRPEWMIITILPVPPLTMRPSIILETGERSEDDLTHKLVDIVRINERLKRILEIGAPDFLIDDIIELLQYHIATYIKNDLSNIPPARHRSGRALKTLAQRLIGKEGRFRFNLTGKRVNFSARSVVSPDNFMDINEVGIPQVVADGLTVPERVTEQNIEEIRKTILTKDKINYVVRLDGLKKKVTEETKELISQELISGYTVERHLEDGDWVIFNRQPSLHRMSMMAHKVKIMEGKTFRTHLCVTTPYNADFDGDEMNLHVPQTEEARVELKHLMDVNKHIRTPRYGLPLIGAKQDHIMGLYFLTKGDIKLTKQEISNLLFCSNIDVKFDKETYTGKEIFSFLLPENLNFKGETKTGEELIIEKGVLKKGYIDVKAVGVEEGMLLNKVDLLYGSEESSKFLNSIIKLGLLFMEKYSYSISLEDYTIGENAEMEIEKIINKKIKSWLQKGGDDESQADLEKILKDVEIIIKKNLSNDSIAKIAAETGARGSLISVGQIIGCVGQEKLKGKRITRGYYGRTLPHFDREQIDIGLYGFVKHGYRKGISPTEFFFDAMGQREGLADTALKTKHSGYLERRLVNSLHDIIVKEDRTVRNESNQIVQFIPFENDINPYKASGGKISFEDLI